MWTFFQSKLYWLVYFRSHQWLTLAPDLKVQIVRNRRHPQWGTSCVVHRLQQHTVSFFYCFWMAEMSPGEILSLTGQRLFQQLISSKLDGCWIFSVHLTMLRLWIYKEPLNGSTWGMQSQQSNDRSHQFSDFRRTWDLAIIPWLGSDSTLLHHGLYQATCY